MLFWLTQLLPHFVFAIYQISLRSTGPPVPLLADSCSPDSPFGPVHLTEYPLKPEYKDYTPEKIPIIDSLAHIQSAREVQLSSCLQVCMEPPVTPNVRAQNALDSQLACLEAKLPTAWKPSQIVSQGKKTPPF
ncbi:hypothetical protein DSO57_1037211 [Entomophthora muscae]|nr:hypothetical protein DSO57_1037211 [Entomophthora muscae]